MRGPVEYLSKKFWGESLQETAEKGMSNRRGARFSAAVFAVYATMAGAWTGVIVNDVVADQVQDVHDGWGNQSLDQLALLPLEAGGVATAWATLELASLAVRSWRKPDQDLPDLPHTAED